ncbi:Gfo/Idh/MocA family oxidoreductase [Alkalihalobacillus oceani]|uniref:Gfo/Idh/MocA family oxidoreductase n=1 Tax=Halalkalibacter oceani TaxID=1653776 RepID=UPI00203C8E3E|nr:Gfo/Idh/MocA family oxidoreductase [Halalkalibacter oceani]MCM3760896.1 Gfo/Idh/MocA family oxidoreductase [Halalkalibacter oceani]
MYDYIREEELLLVGTGNMAQQYSKVLQAQNIPFYVIGRSEKGTMRFEENTGISAFPNGVSSYIQTGRPLPKQAVVAVNVENLYNVATELIDNGVKRILIEKPGGLHFTEVKMLLEKAQKRSVEIFVAYNRRFYSSVIEAQRIIEFDGGVTSFQFDFTEWSHKVEKLNKPKEVLENWLFCNSSHVIDLAFFLGGVPKSIQSYKNGELDWHKNGAIFVGSGVSEREALFSYQANWKAPGRWGIELFTKKTRLILQPLEELYIQSLGSLSIDKVQIEDSLDRQFKPGLYKQIEAFKNHKKEHLLDLRSHLLLCNSVYQKIIE